MVGRFIFAVALGSLCLPLSVRAGVVANSETEFSNVQGANGWYYGYVAPANSPSFVQLPNYYAAWGYGSETPAAWAIDSPVADGTNFFTAIFAGGSHTNGVITSGFKPAEHWTVRRWVSDVAGPVTITGTVGDLKNFGGDQDGVVYQILLDGVAIWNNGTDGSTPDFGYSVDTTLAVGSTLDFVTKPRTSDYADWNTFTASISMIPEPASIGLMLPAIAGLLLRRRR